MFMFPQHVIIAVAKLMMTAPSKVVMGAEHNLFFSWTPSIGYIL